MSTATRIPTFHTRNILRGRTDAIESGKQSYDILHKPAPYVEGDEIKYVEVTADGPTGRTFRKTITCVTELYRHFPGIGEAASWACARPLP